MRNALILWALVLASVPLTINATTTTGMLRQKTRIGGQPTIPNGIVRPPEPVVHPAASYTEAARSRGVEGTVIVRAQFDADGQFKVLQIVKGLGFGLDESAIAALQNWRFSPAFKDGARVSVIAEIEVPFKLEGERVRPVQVELKKMENGLVRFSISPRSVE
jgi:TonB family protein